jgi:hypothetical protein
MVIFSFVNSDYRLIRITPPATNESGLARFYCILFFQQHLRSLSTFIAIKSRKVMRIT